MISKRIDRKNNTSDFERLGCYILEAKTLKDSILWTPAPEYRVSTPLQEHKVLSYRITNCEADMPAMAMAEILITQRQNTRSKADKTYHLVISFPDGEVPTQEQLEDIEDEFCKALGFTEHQRLSAVHQDTDNLHLHIAINKVHPQSFKVMEPYRDFYILSQTCRLLEQRHGLQVDNGMEQANSRPNSDRNMAPDVQEPFLSWIQKTVREPLMELLVNAKSWNDLHESLGQYGLTIKPKGAGLVIALTDGSLTVKASDVLKDLSFKKLTNRWGTYQPPLPEHLKTAKPELCYPKAKSLAQPLWEQYQAHKTQLITQRAEVYYRLRIEHELYTQELKDWYQQRHESLNANHQLTKKSKRILRQQLYNEQKTDYSSSRKQEAQQRRAIREQTPFLNWDQWLMQQANQGNLSALGLLRARAKVRQRLQQALLTVQNLEEAKAIIYPQLKPKTRKNGDVIYRLKDGGLVEDTAKAVFVPEVTDAAILLALSLAQERFPGQPLNISGSIDFKNKVAQMTVAKGMNIRFEAPDIEQERQKQAEVHKTRVQEAENNSQNPKFRPAQDQGRV